MASTASGRGRPAILDKADLDLGNGTNATIRLVGEGDTVQIELPLSWSLDALQRSATRSGGRTKVTFTFDSDLATPSTNGNSNGDSAPAPEAEAAPETKRTRATKKAADTEESEAPVTDVVKAPRRARKKAEVAAA